MSNFYQNLTSSGLTTVSFVVPDAGPLFVKGKVSIPTISNGGGVSALVVTIKQNGTAVYTGLAGSEGFYADFAVAAMDTISVVFSSAAAADQGSNVIKSTISIGYGV